MLVVGIDVAAEVHQVAVIDETESAVVKPTPFAEDAAGYQKLFELLARAGARGGGDLLLAPASAQPERMLVVIEATRSLLAELVRGADGGRLRSGPGQPAHRFAGEQLARTKTVLCLEKEVQRVGTERTA